MFFLQKAICGHIKLKLIKINVSSVKLFDILNAGFESCIYFLREVYNLRILNLSFELYLGLQNVLTVLLASQLVVYMLICVSFLVFKIQLSYKSRLGIEKSTIIL